ncbi:hypothetical protein GCM10023082_36050 [Streptomyces tremellae]|uniref:Uncharacterized protein n=1 Tax=Streptomyces tremellae TaxID=1124239 RepID=A0ABP7FDX4_9ACTN
MIVTVRHDRSWTPAATIRCGDCRRRAPAVRADIRMRTSDGTAVRETRPPCGGTAGPEEGT